MRRIALIAVSSVMSVVVLGMPGVQAVAPVAGETTSHLVAKKAAKVSKKCRKRVLNPRDVVASKRFAKCVTKGMLVGRTAQLKSRYDDGSWAKGPARFTKSTTETSASYSNGDKFVLIAKNAWLKPAGRPWAKAKKNGTEDQQLAWGIQQLWGATSSAAAYRSYLGSSTTGWTPTGTVKKLNGRKAREYVGTPVIAGMTFDRYAVWVDDLDRPIRISSTLSLGQMTSTGHQDFSKWGKPVTIKAPKVG